MQQEPAAQAFPERTVTEALEVRLRDIQEQLVALHRKVDELHRKVDLANLHETEWRKRFTPGS